MGPGRPEAFLLLVAEPSHVFCEMAHHGQEDRVENGGDADLCAAFDRDQAILKLILDDALPDFSADAESATSIRLTSS